MIIGVVLRCEGVMNRLFFADLGGSEQLNKSASHSVSSAIGNVLDLL